MSTFLNCRVFFYYAILVFWIQIVFHFFFRCPFRPKYALCESRLAGRLCERARWSCMAQSNQQEWPLETKGNNIKHAYKHTYILVALIVCGYFKAEPMNLPLYFQLKRWWRKCSFFSLLYACVPFITTITQDRERKKKYERKRVYAFDSIRFAFIYVDLESKIPYEKCDRLNISILY